MQFAGPRFLQSDKHARIYSFKDYAFYIRKAWKRGEAVGMTAFLATKTPTILVYQRTERVRESDCNALVITLGEGEERSSVFMKSARKFTGWFIKEPTLQQNTRKITSRKEN